MNFPLLHGIGELEKSIRKSCWYFGGREKLSTPGVLSKLSKCIISPQTHSQKYELVLLGNKRKTCFDNPVKSLLCTVEVILPELRHGAGLYVTFWSFFSKFSLCPKTWLLIVYSFVKWFLTIYST